MGADGVLNVEVAGIEGTKVELAKQTYVVPAHGPARGKIAAGPNLLQWPYSSAGQTLPAKVISPDGQSEDTTVRIQWTSEVDKVLEKSEGKPALFFGEPAAVGTPKLLWYGGNLFGSGSLAQMELVAYGKDGPDRTGSCGAYRRRSTGAVEIVSRSASTYDVSVYQRKTGKKIAQRRFYGDMPDCPETLSGSSVSGGSVDSEPIHAWLKTFVK